MTTRLGGKTGGRRRGSLDKGERMVVTSEMAADLLTVYKKLGGAKWLLEFAKENPGEFIRSGLSRLWPAPAKDDPDVQVNQQFNFDSNPVEAARRVAFMLASGADQLGIDITPVQTYQLPPMTPQAACHIPEAIPLVQPLPVEDADKDLWIEEIGLSPEARRDAQLVRSTKTGNIESYAGSGAEQGLGSAPHQQQQQPSGRLSVNEIRRRQLL